MLTKEGPNGLVELPAPIVIETDDPSIDVEDPELVAELTAVHESFEPGVSRSVVGPILPELHGAAAVNTGMSVSYDATYPSPSNVQAVVAAAAAQWDTAVATTPTTPVEIAIIWRNLGNPSLLGSAGPAGLYSGGALPPGTYYPAPLANVLLGYDINGAGSPELTVNLNSQTNWYIGTSGNPGAGQIDLYSVVLHEIAHGLGFLGSGSLTNHTPSTTPTLEDTPFVFDHQVAYAGAPLLNHGSPNSLLTSNSLFLHLSDTLANKLYAPASWQEGSSFSHFDESTYPAGSVGALMTPSLSGQETERTIDAATLGVMSRIGWPVRVTAATPAITAASGDAGQVTVSWAQQLHQLSVAPDYYRVEARLGATVAASVTVPATTTTATVTGLADNASYTVAVVPTAKGVDGTAATTVVATATVPLSPKAVSVTGSGGQRTISWLPSSGSSPTSYEVQQSVNGGAWTVVGTTAGTSIVATTGEGTYQFRVRGVNAFGAGIWGSSIPLGLSPTVVRPVPLDGQLSRLYQAYFLRPPDDAGFTYWRDVRAGGSELRSIADAFAGSNEFVSAYGSLNDGQFVDLVYQNVLGRSADATGRAHWISVLGAGVSRGEVMIGFSDSAEFVGNTATSSPQSEAEAEVYRLYVAFFLRTPDASGLDYWVSVRQSGTSLETIAASFAASAEFQASYGALPDATFVELVYHNVLARSADAAGSSYWQSLLAAGVDRGSMMVGFSESEEFILVTGTVP